MAVTPEDMQSWLKQIFNVDGQRQRRSLVDYLKAIPRLESLSDVASGTPVLVRGDLDAKPGPNVGDGDIRLRSMKDTLDYGRQKGWKQVVFGHVGREPEKSLKKVAARLGEIDAARAVAFICHLGGRSELATRFARQHGISRAANVVGGMDRWEAHGYPVER